MKIIILVIVPRTAFSHFILSTFTYTLIRLMISSTYFKCQKDFNKLISEELIGKKKDAQFIELPKYTKEQMEINTQERSKANELRKPIPLQGEIHFLMNCKSKHF